MQRVWQEWCSGLPEGAKERGVRLLSLQQQYPSRSEIAAVLAAAGADEDDNAWLEEEEDLQGSDSEDESDPARTLVCGECSARTSRFMRCCGRVLCHCCWMEYWHNHDQYRLESVEVSFTTISNVA